MSVKREAYKNEGKVSWWFSHELVKTRLTVGSPVTFDVDFFKVSEYDLAEYQRQLWVDGKRK